jgi:large subunit ribosomal protein L32
MVPLPKKRYPKARQGKRRSHLALQVKGLTRCPQCRTMRKPHHACPVCGQYKGREAVVVAGPSLGGE